VDTVVPPESQAHRRYPRGEGRLLVAPLAIPIVVSVFFV
jgi:hypothetical protein